MTATNNTSTVETASKRQWYSFLFALFNFLGLAVWCWVRIYYAIVGDLNGDRAFVFDSLALLPVWVLTWIIGFVIVGNSISKSKQLTWHGVGAILMLAVPAIPVAAIVFMTFWRFLATP